PWRCRIKTSSNALPIPIHHGETANIIPRENSAAVAIQASVGATELGVLRPRCRGHRGISGKQRADRRIHRLERFSQSEPGAFEKRAESVKDWLVKQKDISADIKA